MVARQVIRIIKEALKNPEDATHAIQGWSQEHSDLRWSETEWLAWRRASIIHNYTHIHAHPICHSSTPWHPRQAQKKGVAWTPKDWPTKWKPILGCLSCAAAHRSDGFIVCSVCLSSFCRSMFSLMYINYISCSVVHTYTHTFIYITLYNARI